jgi:hypothetical protein
MKPLTMNNCRRLLLAGLVTLPGACLAQSGAQAAPPQGQPAPGTAAASTPQALPKVCLDAQADSDSLIAEFADRLRQTITASGALTLAAPGDTCNLQLHVPGNLLRFETAGGVMVSTVVIVTSPSGSYLSTSISACRADELQPCAVRAVAAAKLALLLTPTPDGGT